VFCHLINKFFLKALHGNPSSNSFKVSIGLCCAKRFMYSDGAR